MIHLQQMRLPSHCLAVVFLGLLLLASVSGQKCPICGVNRPLPFPDRVVYLPDEKPTTCKKLQDKASRDKGLCVDIEMYQFYCGCPDAFPKCSFCPSGLTPIPDLVLKGYAPSYFEDPEEWTCGEMERQRSTLSANQCGDLIGNENEIATLCGCQSEPASSNCTTVCPDGTLIDPSLNSQVIYNGVTCSEYQLDIAKGKATKLECESAAYLGIKFCGCEQTRDFCELCEDGSVPSKPLDNFISYEAGTVLEAVGWGYSFDPADPLCAAWQSSFGRHAGCDNPIANEGACRICDEAGGDVVPFSDLTIPVPPDNVVDCADLEFAGEWELNMLNCATATELGSRCCPPFTPSASPTTSIAPTPGLKPPTSSPTTLEPVVSVTETSAPTTTTITSGSPPVQQAVLFALNAMATTFAFWNLQ